MTEMVDLDMVNIVIPVLNDEKAIGLVLNEVLDLGIPWDNIIVIAGVSDDRTVEIAKSYGVKVVFQKGRGKADAVRMGLNYVSTPWMVVMDGDGIHLAMYIPNLLRNALVNGCDLVIGVRVFGEEL